MKNLMSLNKAATKIALVGVLFSTNVMATVPAPDPLQPFRDQFAQGRPMTFQDISSLSDVVYASQVPSDSLSILSPGGGGVAAYALMRFSSGLLPEATTWQEYTRPNSVLASFYPRVTQSHLLIIEAGELRMYWTFKALGSGYETGRRETFRINGDYIIDKVEYNDPGLGQDWTEFDYDFVDFKTDALPAVPANYQKY